MNLIKRRYLAVFITLICTQMPLFALAEGIPESCSLDDNVLNCHFEATGDVDFSDISVEGQSIRFESSAEEGSVAVNNLHAEKKISETYFLELYTHDGGDFEFNDLYMDVTNDRDDGDFVSLFLLFPGATSTLALKAKERGYIHTDASTVFQFGGGYFEEGRDLITVDNYKINNSGKVTSSDVSDNYHSIIQLYSGYPTSFNVAFNNCELVAESLLSESSADSSFNFRLKNTQAQFKTLISSNAGAEPNMTNTLNLSDNSVVTSGIYSWINGGKNYQNVSVNLSSGSQFIYTGGCTENCVFDYTDDLPEVGDSYSDIEGNDFIWAEADIARLQESYLGKMTLADGAALIFDSKGDFKQLHLGELSATGSDNIIGMNTDLSAGKGDFLNIDQASGKFGLHIADSGKEAKGKQLDIIHVGQGEDEQFSLNENGLVDYGVYMYELQSRQDENGEYTWFLAQEGDGAGKPEKPEKPEGPHTSAATDAVLNMASVAQFIFEGELQSLRQRRGDVMQNQDEYAGVWGRMIANDMRVYGAAGSAYRLNQSGMEIGVDKVQQVASGHVSYGVSASTSSTQVKHGRGGNSNVDSVMAGLYATYQHDNGVYLDSVLKMANFRNKMNARSTNGSAINGTYNQNALGGALESGYKYQFGADNGKGFVEPYLRATYLTVNDKALTLNNGMAVDVSRHHSLRGEAGINLGTEILVTAHSRLSPYVKVAFEREFIKSNQVSLNNIIFADDVSGNRGKYGVGLNLTIDNNVSIFAEGHYTKGKHVESPIMADVGFRIAF